MTSVAKRMSMPRRRQFESVSTMALIRYANGNVVRAIIIICHEKATAEWRTMSWCRRIIVVGERITRFVYYRRHRTQFRAVNWCDYSAVCNIFAAKASAKCELCISVFFLPSYGIVFYARFASRISYVICVWLHVRIYCTKIRLLFLHRFDEFQNLKHQSEWNQKRLNSLTIVWIATVLQFYIR